MACYIMPPTSMYVYIIQSSPCLPVYLDMLCHGFRQPVYTVPSMPLLTLCIYFVVRHVRMPCLPVCTHIVCLLYRPFQYTCIDRGYTKYQSILCHLCRAYQYTSVYIYIYFVHVLLVYQYSEMVGGISAPGLLTRTTALNVAARPPPVPVPPPSPCLAVPRARAGISFSDAGTKLPAGTPTSA